MPKLSNRTVSLKDSTKIIIDCWHESLSEAGLIRPRQIKEGDDVSASNFYGYEPTSDSNTCNALLFSRIVERQSASVGESVSRFFRGLLDGTTGDFSTLCKDEYSIADNDMYAFWQEYQTEQFTILMRLPKSITKSKIDEDRLTREKINDPHILAAEILQRATLYAISKEKLQDSDHPKYWTAIEVFIHKICREKTVFQDTNGNFDLFATFLLEDHKRKFLDSFKCYVAHQKQANLHHDTIAKMGDYVRILTAIIKKQLVVYWEPSTTADKLKESTYLGTLKTIEDRKQKLAIQRLEEESRSAARTKSSALVVRGAQLPCTSREDMLVFYAQTLREFYKADITELYALLVSLEKIKAMHENIAKLFSAASWLSSFVLKLSTFVEYLKKFHEDNQNKLHVKGKLNTNCPGAHALLHVAANHIDHLTENLQVIHQQANRIDHPQHKIELKRDLAKTLESLMSSQKELGICMIEPAYLEQLSSQLVVSSSESRHGSLVYEQVGSQSSIPMLELPPRRQVSPILQLEDAPTVVQDSERLSQEEPIVPPHRSLAGPDTEVVNPNIRFGQVLGLLKRGVFEEVNKMFGHFEGSDSRLLAGKLNTLRNNEGKTLLHITIEEADYRATAWLLVRGANIFSEDNAKMTPFKLAGRYLLRDKANVDAANAGKTKLEQYTVPFFNICFMANSKVKYTLIQRREKTECIAPLIHFCEETTAEFAQYNHLQQERVNSKLWRVGREVKDVFGLDLTVARAEELADAYVCLLAYSDTGDQDIFCNGIQQILRQKKCADGSVLHKILEQVLQKFEGFSNAFLSQHNLLEEEKCKPQIRQSSTQASSSSSGSNTVSQEEHQRVIQENARLSKENDELSNRVARIEAMLGMLGKTNSMQVSSVGPNSIFSQSSGSSSLPESFNSAQNTGMMPFPMDDSLSV